MRKLLLSFGTIATAMVPIMTVVSCGDDKEITNAQKLLNKMESFYTKAESYDAIKDNVKTLKAGDEWPKSLNVVAHMNTELSKDEKDKSKFQSSAFVAEDMSKDSTNIKVKYVIKEMDGKTEISKASKIFTIKYDNEAPKLSVNTTTTIEGKNITNYTTDDTTGNTSGNLVFDKASTSTKIKISDIGSLITVTDNAFNASFESLDKALIFNKKSIGDEDAEIDIATEDTTGKNLEVFATDPLGNESIHFTLKITVVDSNASNAQKAINVVEDFYIKAENYDAIKDNVKTLKAGDKIDNTLLTWGINQSGPITKKDNIIFYAYVAEDMSEESTNIKVNLVTKEMDDERKTEISKASKIFTAKYDNGVPKLIVNTTTTIEGKNITNYAKDDTTGNTSGNLVFDKASTSTKIKISDIGKLITAADNAFNFSWNVALFLTYKYDGQIVTNDTEIDIATEDTTGKNLEVFATDPLGNESIHFTLKITVVDSSVQ